MILDATSAVATSSAPEVTQADVSKQKLDEDLNQFLTLLTTQLKNQDPLDPLDATEFTSQLVQFASVEQQIYQNSNLEKLLAVQQSSQVASMVDYLGTTIEATGNEVYLENDHAEFAYVLTETAVSNTIHIQDATGRTVVTVNGETGIGRHDFVWDGTDAFGNKLPDGAYTIRVSAQDYEGNLLDVVQTTSGRVTGASSDDGNIMLFMNSVAVPMESILAVRDTSPPAPSGATQTDDVATEETDTDTTDPNPDDPDTEPEPDTTSP